MISDFVERLCDVVDEILCILKSAGVSYQVREYAARLEFLVVHLAVGCACRVQAAGSCVCNVMPKLTTPQVPVGMYFCAVS